VYVEKPCSHDMFEARQIVAAARKYDRLVQQDSQSRSAVALRDAVQKMRDGLIGDVYMARGLCFKWRDTIGRAPVEPVPAGVDYDLWLGPAPKHAFTKNRFHYNWHWFWDYGNGDLGNQGIHEVDIARWGLGVKYPTKVSAMGGHFMFDDDQETPNTINCRQPVLRVEGIFSDQRVRAVPDLAWKRTGAWTFREAGRRSLRELHRCGAQPETAGPDRRD
jgi:Oxidoreductase family, C-terminal alpha/beta domain